MVMFNGGFTMKHRVTMKHCALMGLTWFFTMKNRGILSHAFDHFYADSTS